MSRQSTIISRTMIVLITKSIIVLDFFTEFEFVSAVISLVTHYYFNCSTQCFVRGKSPGSSFTSPQLTTDGTFCGERTIKVSVPVPLPHQTQRVNSFTSFQPVFLGPPATNNHPEKCQPQQHGRYVDSLC